MLNRFIISISLLLFIFLFNPQSNLQAGVFDTVANGRLRVSLLTCGVGEEAWETFGHTGIRVIDSNLNGPYRDIVYNYGMFNFGKDFELKFMSGKLLYYIGIQTFSDFMQDYIGYNRSVTEQELMLDDMQKVRLCNALAINTLPENKYYKYDFFFDNCATRIRDIIPNSVKDGFIYGQALANNERISFRDIINRYYYRKHWSRIGVNILLGSRIDRVMTNSDIMFLPDYLSKGLEGATVNGKSISTHPIALLSGSPHLPAETNSPFVLFLIIAILTVAGLSLKQLQLLGRIMKLMLLFLTGALGCFILVMWFGTDHQACGNNFNILWLLPTNLIIAFLKPKGRGKYALVAGLLIFVTLLLHFLKIQQITLLELSPLYLALLFVYGSIFKSSLQTKTIGK